MVTGALVLPYNARLTGSPRTFPIMAFTDKYYGPGTNDLGFGPDKGLPFGGIDPLPGHGPLDVVVNAAFNSFQVNVELLGWSVGSVLLLVLAVTAGRRLARADWWQLAVIAMIAGIHSFYWFSGGPDFGARYWYLIVVPCVALVARAIGRMRWPDESGALASSSAARAPALALGLVLCTLTVFVPWRGLGKYRNYRGMQPGVRVLAKERNFGRSLVLVRGRRFPDYASAAAYNPVDLHADAPVYAWDVDKAIRDSTILAYGDRMIWFVDGPSLTHDGFRVAAGPLSAPQALSLALPSDIAGDSAHAFDPVHPPPPAGARR